MWFSILMDDIFPVLFEGCPGYSAGTVRYCLHIYGRPCIGLVLDCGFSANRLSHLPGFVSDVGFLGAETGFTNLFY